MVNPREERNVQIVNKNLSHESYSKKFTAVNLFSAMGDKFVILMPFCSCHKLAAATNVFWSLDQLVVETLGVTSVRPFVTLFLGNSSLLFSKTLQLVRACKCEKNVPSTFDNFHRFGHFGKKLVKIGHLAGCVEESL